MRSFLMLVGCSMCWSGPSAEEEWSCTPSQSALSEVSSMRVPLRGRRMLTDRESVPEYINYADLRRFPLLLECTAQQGLPLTALLKPLFEPAQDSCSKTSQCSEESKLQSIFDTPGAVLLRGLPLANASDLSKLLHDLGTSDMPYTGGVAPRSEVSKGVMQASIEPASVTIEPHWEMSYAADYPQILLFFCSRRPQKAGEGLTPITDGRAVLRRLRELGIAQVFQERGVLYCFHYPSKYDASTDFATFVWQVVFGTDSREEVDAFLHRRQKQYPSLRWTWIDNGNVGAESLEYTFRAEAIALHSTGEQVWFNQITSMHRSYFHSHATFPSLLEVPVPFGPENDLLYPFDTSFGDGEEIPGETVRIMREVYWNHTQVFQWEPGDLLILDNMAAAHGRMDYEDSGERELFVSLLSPYSSRPDKNRV
eukprot:TRINITY_DN111455_c0_g1_i1.p1 TRINITY_DN111455_c0_g1~~TRINITY_DN111455_c0_g1_i1.p1  ORF type:complete len:424 (-),score=55.83 TRINITY_DN111455_c0_g1_i1:238-1509(-)